MFSVSGVLPTGVSVSFSPQSVNSSGSSTMTVSTSSTMAIGSYTLISKSCAKLTLKIVILWFDVRLPEFLPVCNENLWVLKGFVLYICSLLENNNAVQQIFHLLFR